MNEEILKKYWLPFTVLGMLPGVLLWILLYQIGFAGEYAGILMGLGGIGVLRRSGAKLSRGKLIFGIVVLILLSLIANHIGYVIEVHNDLNEGFIEAYELGDKVEFGYGDAISFVHTTFLINNDSNMRSIYLEAAVHGALCALLFWCALYFYYVKLDEIEKEGNEREDGQGKGKNNQSSRA